MILNLCFFIGFQGTLHRIDINTKGWTEHSQGIRLLPKRRGRRPNNPLLALGMATNNDLEYKYLHIPTIIVAVEKTLRCKNKNIKQLQSWFFRSGVKIDISYNYGENPRTLNRYERKDHPASKPKSPARGELN